MQSQTTLKNVMKTVSYQVRYLIKRLIMPYYLTVRFPTCRIDHGVMIDRISRLSEGVHIEPNSELRNVTVGRFTCIGADSKYSNCHIGAFCSLGPQVMAGLGSHPTQFVSTYPGFYSANHSTALIRFVNEQRFEEHRGVEIGSDVWVGARVTILGGVKIGDGAVLAAGSVITYDVPPYAIVGGVPAKTLRMRFDDTTISGLEKIRWWEKPVEWLNERSDEFLDPKAFLREFSE